MQQYSFLLPLSILLIHGYYTSSVYKFSNLVSNVNMYKNQISVPRSQIPLKRLPSHLENMQHPHKKADDVIHMIQSPQHFGKLILQMDSNAAITQKKQPQERVIQPKSTNQKPTSATMKVATKTSLTAPKHSLNLTKLKRAQQTQQYFGVMKVNRPMQWLVANKQNYEPVISVTDSADSKSKETHLQQSQALNFSSQMPREILASVRKRDRVRQQQQNQKQQIQRPSQRHKTFITHTVIKDQLYDRTQVHGGNKHKSMGEKWQKTRMRRDLNDILRKKRVDLHSEALNALYNAKIDVQKGTKLLLHLNDLLKNANLFLPEERKVVDLSSKYSTKLRNNLNINNKHILNPGDLKLQQFITNSLNVTDLLERNFVSKRKGSINIHEVSKQNNRKSQSIFGSSSMTRSDQHLTDTVLYDDVMENIRDMLQSKDLELLEEHPNRGFNETEGLLKLKSSKSFQFIENKTLQQLDDYINELQRFAKYLPNTYTLTNQRPQFEESVNSNDSANWYVANSKGNTCGAQLNIMANPNTTLFHYILEIPKHN